MGDPRVIDAWTEDREAGQLGYRLMQEETSEMFLEVRVEEDGDWSDWQEEDLDGPGFDLLCRLPDLLAEQLAARDQEHRRLLSELVGVFKIGVADLPLPGLPMGPAVLEAAKTLKELSEARETELVAARLDAATLRNANRKLGDDLLKAEEATAVLAEEAARLAREKKGLVELMSSHFAGICDMLTRHGGAKPPAFHLGEGGIFIDDPVPEKESEDWELRAIRKFADRVEAMKAQSAVERAPTAEAEDRYEGSAQEKINKLTAALDASLEVCLKKAEIPVRLIRLDVLLASEEVPAGLAVALDLSDGLREEVAAAAWRWFRSRLVDEGGEG